jgi:hypothetical protein
MHRTLAEALSSQASADAGPSIKLLTTSARRKNCSTHCSFPEKTTFFGKAADQVIRYAFDLG